VYFDGIYSGVYNPETGGYHMVGLLSYEPISRIDFELGTTLDMSDPNCQSLISQIETP